ncbi:MAG: sugar ABC transporter permease, partial [Lachnospiraceae bacterium]|nr:sugar ABC transporter permease [Lachnospiraceae bacterium]
MMSTSRQKSLKTHQRVSNVFAYILLVVLSIIWLTPFVLIVFESFRTETTMQVGYVIPKVWGFANYKTLFDKNAMDFIVWYKNTFIIAIICAPIQTFMVLCMSYTL